jgi:uncharacterized protein YggL (DUF469 family)
MANRSRRLRKKLRVDEFQEMGFDISFNFRSAPPKRPLMPWSMR